MNGKASGSFDIDSWDQEVYDEEGGITLSRTVVTKTFHGDLDGTSRANLLLAGSEVEGSAGYVGIERFTGTVADRAGSCSSTPRPWPPATERARSWSSRIRALARCAA